MSDAWSLLEVLSARRLRSRCRLVFASELSLLVAIAAIAAAVAPRLWRSDSWSLLGGALARQLRLRCRLVFGSCLSELSLFVAISAIAAADAPAAAPRW